ncbi:uncharacterized protein LOC143910049 [Arctopsyche grandis]|uniref:uncharacterized protein LOC143910049 n=1 Tax=Arctopsyche grandis TaxID=121162 RepID=UPI00406D8697
MDHAGSSDWDSKDNDLSETNDPLDPFTVFVNKIPKTMGDVSLREMLEVHGTVVSFYAPPSHPLDGLSYALCKYESPWHAQAAIHALNAKQPLHLQVNLAKKKNNEKKKRSPNENRHPQNSYFQQKKNGNNNNKQQYDDKKFTDNTRGSYGKFHRINQRASGMNAEYDKKKDESYHKTDMLDFSENKSNSKAPLNNSFNNKKNDMNSSEQFFTATKNHFQRVSGMNVEFDQKKDDSYDKPDKLDFSENKSSSKAPLNNSFKNKKNDINSSEQFFTATKNYFQQMNNIDETSKIGKMWNVIKEDKEPAILKISQKCPSCSQSPGGKIKFGYSFASSADDFKDINKSQETSPEKNDDLKVVYDDFEEGYEFVITLVEHLPNKTWICLLTSVKFKDFYNSLFAEFANECNKNLNSSTAVDENTNIVAVCILENREKVWYRAIEFVNGKFSLIDRGVVIHESQTTHKIACPERFEEIPKFCGILRILSDSAENFKVDESMLWKVSYNNGKSCIVSYKNIIGLLEDWNPTDDTDKSQKSHINKTPKIDNKEPAVTKSLESFPKIASPLKNAIDAITNKKHFEMNLFEQNALIPQSGQTIVIVNYVNSKEIYIRLHGTANDKEYTNILNGVAIASDYAAILSDPPEINTMVLCKYEKGYYRAKVVSVKDGYFNVNFIDIGKFALVKLSDMKECKGSLNERPVLIARITLQGWERIHPNEPSPNIQDFINDIIKNETPISMTFDDFQNGVQLKTQLSKTDINQKLTDMTMSVLDKLKRDKKKPYELKVIMISDVVILDFDDLVATPKPVKLILLDTSQLLTTQYITCTKYDMEMISRFQILTRQINDYCNNQPEHYLPRENEMCLALYEKDDSWYRAFVVREDGENVKVQFVDYGNVAILHMTKIKKIVSDFTTLPIIGCMCEISGVPNDASVKQEVIKFLMLQENNIIEVSDIVPNTFSYSLEIPNLMMHLKSENLL